MHDARSLMTIHECNADCRKDAVDNETSKPKYIRIRSVGVTSINTNTKEETVAIDRVGGVGQVRREGINITWSPRCV